MKASLRALGLSLTLLNNTCWSNSLIGSVLALSVDEWNATKAVCITDCRYIMGMIEQPNQHIAFLGKFIPEPSSKFLFWKITDQLPYTDNNNGFELAYGHCEVDGQSDSSLLAILKPSDTEWNTNIRMAYRSNLDTERFEPITTQGMRCENLAAGL